MKHDTFINYIGNADYDEDKKLYTLHMANTFTKTEFHLTIGKELLDEMIKDPNVFDSTILRHDIIRGEGAGII